MDKYGIIGLVLAISLTVLGLYNLHLGDPNEVFGAYFDLVLAGITGYIVLFWKAPEEDEKKKKKNNGPRPIYDFIRYSIPAIVIGGGLFFLAKIFSI